MISTKGGRPSRFDIVWGASERAAMDLPGIESRSLSPYFDSGSILTPTLIGRRWDVRGRV